MPYDRDVRAFDERAASYEAGMLGQLHRDISGRVADLALSLRPAPRRVLDVGAGTGRPTSGCASPRGPRNDCPSRADSLTWW